MVGEQQRFHEMLAPSVEALGCELLGVQISRGPRHSVLRVYIDKPEGITLDDCEKVSHQLSGILDVEDPVEGEYSLEVSSPGSDRPLFLEQHYRRFAGHRVRIRLSIPVSGRRNLTGTLAGVRQGDVLLELEGAQVALPLEQIAQARLVPDETGRLTPGGTKQP